MTAPPRRPQDALPDLLPGSARRLVRLDVLRTPQAHGRAALEVVASARDEVATVDGVRLLARADVRVLVVDGLVTGLSSVPEVPFDAVVGSPVTGGFRRAARAALEAAGDVGDGTDLPGPTPLEALLDDVPVAALVSGYLDVRSGALGAGPETAELLVDVCAGWRADGAPLRTARRSDAVPVSPLTPVGPWAARPGPPLDLPPLPAGALRRLRWVQVSGPGTDDDGAVRSGFRDSAVEDAVVRDGAVVGSGEGVLHEYAVTARVGTDGTVGSLVAEPRVLPFSDCLGAVPGVTALDGRPAADLPRDVLAVLAGPRGCTHLNDLLRSLACVPRLHAATRAPALR